MLLRENSQLSDFISYVLNKGNSSELVFHVSNGENSTQFVFQVPDGESFQSLMGKTQGS